MSYQTFKTFASFWNALLKRVRRNNHPTYHPCCKSWTWRARKGSKTTHTEQIKWGAVLSSIEDKEFTPKERLQTHMVEHGWGPPIRVSVQCLRVTQVPCETGGQNPFKNLKKQKLQSAALTIHKPARAASRPLSVPNPGSTRSMHTRKMTETPSQAEQADENLSLLTPTSATPT